MASQQQQAASNVEIQGASRFLATLFGGYGVLPSARVELRCFSTDGGRPLQSWHDLSPSGLRSASDKALSLARTHDVYCTVLPRREHEGSAAGIRLCRWLWVDIDGGDDGPEGSADLLRSSVRRLRLPEPSMIVLSGGGLHAYWPLADVVPCRTPEDQERVRNTLRRLVRAIGGDVESGGAHADRASAEPARILRIPGTFNHKRGLLRPVRLLRCIDGGDDAKSLVWWRAHLPAEPLPLMQQAQQYRQRFMTSSGTVCNNATRRYDTPPPKVREKLAGVPDGTKHRSMVEVAVWARKEGLSESEIRNYAAQVAASSGVNLADAHQQHHLEDIVSYVMTNVQPAPQGL